MSGDYTNYIIIENGQNTVKSPEDLKRLAVTQTSVKDHQQTLMEKTFKGQNDNDKCATLIMKNWKRHMSEGMELLNHEKVRTLDEKETCKYKGISEADTIKEAEMKEKIKKEYLGRTRKLLETKL